MPSPANRSGSSRPPRPWGSHGADNGSGTSSGSSDSMRWSTPSDSASVSVHTLNTT